MCYTSEQAVLLSICLFLFLFTLLSAQLTIGGTRLCSVYFHSWSLGEYIRALYIVKRVVNVKYLVDSVDHVSPFTALIMFSHPLYRCLAWYFCFVLAVKVKESKWIDGYVYQMV
jgi:hypothetical protein